MDDDGFTSADPAPVPTDQQADMMGDVTVVGEDVDCRNCIHFPVCAYFAGIQPMLEQREDPAIQATDLAVICEEYERADDSDETEP